VQAGAQRKPIKEMSHASVRATILNYSRLRPVPVWQRPLAAGTDEFDTERDSLKRAGVPGSALNFKPEFPATAGAPADGEDRDPARKRSTR
jgi:hypothetical protein